MDFFETIYEKVKQTCPKIIFPEGNDERVINAAIELEKSKIIKPLLLGAKGVIDDYASNHNLEIIEPDENKIIPFRDEAYELLAKKYSQHQIDDLLLQPNYYAMMLLKHGKADGLVGGAQFPTPEIIKPALKIIGMESNINRLSSYFLMIKDEQVYFFSDCAVNVLPNSEELAEIAYLTAHSATMFDVSPKVAFLSYSTKKSSISEQTETVQKAYELFMEKHPYWPSEGEIQLDAAIHPEVSNSKTLDSPLKGRANVLIFPNLDAGNIGYKLTERLGLFSAIGPVLQGLGKPVNDLSRGCSSEDIFRLAILTGLQVISKQENTLI
ncbi:phosphotransacetylase [Natribacillus halophilus]|uniref:Phosphotransacetylase n=1 Tax=Natribacillus halophilus TaxID=549003 RepID=A0A1G8N6F8_9BACI|nr:phosphotransacetylase [Natribacillus halophilus]SDI75150.1 phosphotransacetylase [Natribacillus halophilus]